MLYPLFGVVDDATITLHDRKIVSLRGFWRFTAPGISTKLRIDKEWRLQGIENVSSAHYTLTLFIPPALRTGDFGLILPPVSAALKIRLNGKLVAEKGRVDPQLRFPQDSSEAFSWYTVKNEYLAPGTAQELDLEITGFQGGGGVYGNAHIYFGGVAEISQKYNRIFLITCFLAAAILMIALFHFALVSAKHSRRANLHFVLLSLAMAFHILGMNGLGYYLVNEFAVNATLIHTIIATFPFAMVGFSLRYFHLTHRWIRFAAYVYLIVMGLTLVCCLLFPTLIPYYLKYGLTTGVGAMAAALAFAIYASIRGVIGGVEGAKIVLLGFVIYAFAVLNDITFYFSYASSMKLADAGFLIAVVCIALALATRLEQAAVEKDELHEWHKEITLAAQIQNTALQKRSLKTTKLEIATLFQPMKIIGGDFFAFHEISENKTGVFIADVSGHGIAAALLVNTIKSIFLQQRERALMPAELLRNMNSALFPHLQEQFVTAAYCVFDFENGKISVAQAGHPPLYFMERKTGAVCRVKPKGRFLGFESEIRYETTELAIGDYARVFLYSDGIIEAGSISGRPYTSNRLEELLARTVALKGDALLKELESDIRTVSHAELNRDDDSSCVVVDLLVA